ncbi:MAG: cysteine desulfurase family protein [Acidimicrobiales bacterium]
MSERHYLDHASTSPCRPVVVAAMVPWFGVAGDPGRIHHEGHVVRASIEQARAQVAELFGARSREVIFTSGATESCVTATWMATERGPHVVVSQGEHSSVRESAARHEVTTVGLDRLGRVSPDEVMAAVRDDTALVHLQWGNHEVGTLQPVDEVIARCRERGVLTHVDAAAAAGHVPINFAALGADLMSISAHKMGGPPGIGALLVRRGLRLRPLLVGGAQERARRAGYENVPAIMGFGELARLLAEGGLIEEVARSERLIDLVVAAAADGSLGPGIEMLGDPQPSGRLPHMLCLGIHGVEAEPVLLGLDQSGLAVHSGSSCSSELLEPSPVLEAMGVDASRSLRVSVGWSSSVEDVHAFCQALPTVLKRLQALGSS